jgi:hypothetical protein
VVPEAIDEQSSRWSLRDQRAGAGVALAAVLIIGVVIWYAIDTRVNRAPAYVTSTSAVAARGPVAVSPAELETLAAALGHPCTGLGRGQTRRTS